MNVLSLFDGISCGQLALQRANIRVDNYFASEIDKYAIKIAMKNFPNTIQLGNIHDWMNWDLPKIDLLIGGSPCQGFSVAGQGLNFDDPRSALFFEYVDVLKHCKPTWFLLENVKMKKEWVNIISGYLKVAPIEINSALVSAQNRKRLYWTNIPDVTQPEDKGILLKDIIENNPPNYAYVSKNHAGHVKLLNQKAGCLTEGAHSGGNHSDMTLVKTIPHGYMKEETKERDKYPALVGQDPSTKYLIKIVNIYPSKGQNGNVYSTEGKSPSLSAGIGIKGRGIGSSNSPKIAIKPNCIAIIPEEHRPKGNYLPRERVFSSNGKSRAVSTDLSQHPYYDDGLEWRRLTTIECERLQTLPDNYTEFGKSVLHIDELFGKISSWKKFVKSMIAKEKATLVWMSASCTISDINDTTHLNFQNDNLKNVAIVIEFKSQEECAINIIKIGKDMEMLSIPIKLEKSNKISQTSMDTLKKEVKTIESFIGTSWNRCWENILIQMILSTILILINQTTNQKTYMSVPALSTKIFISNLNELLLGSSKGKSLFLKMENIKKISNTQRYKMLGNGWTVDVIAHIFSCIPK